MAAPIDAKDFFLLVRLSNGSFVNVSVLDIELIWHIKVKLYRILNIPPERQMLYLLGEVKELENLARVLDFPELKIMKGEKRLVILREKKEDLSKKIRKKGLVVKGKKFRETLCPQHSYAGGRGLERGITNLVNTFQIHSMGKDLQPIISKDAAKYYEVIISTKESNENVQTNKFIQFQGSENDNITWVHWISSIPGTFVITIRTTDGYAICGSPFTISIVDHENSGITVKNLVHSEFTVEAARIILEWSTKEEYNNILLKEIGVDTILALGKAEPSTLIQPIIVDILKHLLEKDAFRIGFYSLGVPSLLDIVELNKSTKNPIISRFISKSFSLLGHYVNSELSTLDARDPIPTVGVFNYIDTTFFEVIEEMLKTIEDIETIRYLSRSLASFSGCPFYSSMIANLLPYITSLFENMDCDYSTRRYALISISNITSFMEISKIKFNLITESTVQKLISSVDYPLTGDQFVTDSLKALANLCDYPQFCQIISSHPCVERVVKSIGGTDSLANWEIFASVQLLNESNNSDMYKEKFMRSYSHDDNFNYESVRLLYKLLLNKMELPKIIVKYNAIRSLVRFINSANLGLQEMACNIVALLSKTTECRKEIIQFGGLQSLCLAMNTCNPTAIAPIVASLAQMPLNVKGMLVNIIGDSGVRKLVEYYRDSDNNELRKHAAILLASLVGNDGSYDIIKQGGSELLKSLIDLIKNRTVNVTTFIPPHELQFRDIVGEGISGVVWEAVWKDEVVAVKKFNEESISFSEEEFQSEVALMSVLRHENISHCLGSWTGEENYYIVSELFERGSLATIIEDTAQDLNIPMIIHLSLGAAKGMNYLHRLGIIHRDLKAGNLLVTFDWCVKVADFGLSRISDKMMTRGVGTPIYTAPEVLAGNSYTLKADVYSFAYVLWEMVTRKVPFEDLPPFEAVHRAATEKLRPPLPENGILNNIITRCWDSDPQLRPEFEEIIKILSEIQVSVGNPNLYDFNGNEEDEDEKSKKSRKMQALKNLHININNDQKKKGNDSGRYSLLRNASSSKIKNLGEEQTYHDLRASQRKNFGFNF